MPTNEDNAQDTGGKQRTAKQQKIRKKTVANRARHRLMSIRYDVQHFCRPVLEQPHLRGLPVVANERCGAWYAYSLMKDGPTSCYFKSTDGHVGTWNFSLKRLNLNILRLVAQHQSCVIFDASTSKELPDSFSRTIPIWAAVLNRIAVRYRQELGMQQQYLDEWDFDVYTPNFVVSPEERNEIRSLIDSRVETLYRSQAIVDPSWLASTLVKPLRPFWITPQHLEETIVSNDCFSIICVSCSEYQPKSARKEAEAFPYTAGAADDHESWARHLNPRLFWDNIQTILDEPDATDDATDLAIDSIVQRELEQNDAFEIKAFTSQERLFDAIGSTNVFVGTRRAGRPPECWNHFDAILNVTDTEYPDIISSSCQSKEPIKRPDEVGSEQRNGFFYLQLPVSEGKRDKLELEQWMAIGIVFVFMHARQNRKVLIHCAQGKDRSVAMAMAVVTIFCDLKFPLRWSEFFWSVSLDGLLQENDDDASYISSGLPRRVVHRMLGREGRDRLFVWVREEQCDRSDDEALATKQSLRVALLLIQQDREKADPSRSTMQKLNRFFMSKSSYRHV